MRPLVRQTLLFLRNRFLCGCFLYSFFGSRFGGRFGGRFGRCFSPGFWLGRRIIDLVESLVNQLQVKGFSEKPQVIDSLQKNGHRPEKAGVAALLEHVPLEQLHHR